MRMLTKVMTVAAVGGGFLLGWFAHAGVADAQTRKPIMMTRIYTGADGQSHAEEVPMPMAANGSTPAMKASSLQFSSRPASPVSGWHPGPRRQYIITLAGRVELEVANGQKVQIGPGSIELIEDTTGKGHTTHIIEDRIMATIPLE